MGSIGDIDSGFEMAWGLLWRTHSVCSNNACKKAREQDNMLVLSPLVVKKSQTVSSAEGYPITWLVHSWYQEKEKNLQRHGSWGSSVWQSGYHLAHVKVSTSPCLITARWLHNVCRFSDLHLGYVIEYGARVLKQHFQHTDIAKTIALLQVST